MIMYIGDIISNLYNYSVPMYCDKTRRWGGLNRVMDVRIKSL